MPIANRFQCQSHCQRLWRDKIRSIGRALRDEPGFFHSFVASYIRNRYNSRSRRRRCCSSAKPWIQVADIVTAGNQSPCDALVRVGFLVLLFELHFKLDRDFITPAMSDWVTPAMSDWVTEVVKTLLTMFVARLPNKSSQLATSLAKDVSRVATGIKTDCWFEDGFVCWCQRKRSLTRR